MRMDGLEIAERRERVGGSRRAGWRTLKLSSRPRYAQYTTLRRQVNKPGALGSITT